MNTVKRGVLEILIIPYEIPVVAVIENVLSYVLFHLFFGTAIKTRNLKFLENINETQINL